MAVAIWAMGGSGGDSHIDGRYVGLKVTWAIQLSCCGLGQAAPWGANTLARPLALQAIFLYRIFMAPSIFRTEKRRGRPRIDPTSIHLTLAPDQLAKLDEWISQRSVKLSRPEAVRRLVEQALAGGKGGNNSFGKQIY